MMKRKCRQQYGKREELMEKEIVIIYFSATGNTKKSLTAMAEAIGKPYEEIDLTLPGTEKEYSFTEDQFVIIGAPAYAGRIPNLARGRFSLLKGDGTFCLPVISFGNREIDDALLELSDLMEERGFVTAGGAAVIGRHTYGEVQVSRPDEADLEEAGEFAKQIWEKVQAARHNRSEESGGKAGAEEAFAELILPGSRPYKKGLDKGAFRPLTTEDCVQCGLCARECPAGAIADDFVTVSDACISCFRCIRNCPVHAKHSGTPEYTGFVESFINKFREPGKENRFYS